MKKKLLLLLVCVVLICIVFCVIMSRDIIGLRSFSYVPRAIQSVNYNNYSHRYNQNMIDYNMIDYKGDTFAYIKRGVLSNKLVLVNSAGDCESFAGIGVPFQLCDSLIIHFREGSLLCRNMETGEDLVIDDDSDETFVATSDYIFYCHKYLSNDTDVEFYYEDLMAYNISSGNNITLHSHVADFCLCGSKIYVTDFERCVYEISIDDFRKNCLIEDVEYCYYQMILSYDDSIIFDCGFPSELAILNTLTLDMERIHILSDTDATDVDVYMCDPANCKLYYSYQKRHYNDDLTYYNIDNEQNGLYEIDLKTKAVTKLMPDTFEQLYLFDGDKLFGIHDNSLYLVDINKKCANKI